MVIFYVTKMMTTVNVFTKNWTVFDIVIEHQVKKSGYIGPLKSVAAGSCYFMEMVVIYLAIPN